jgi:hypothetical protein
MFERSGGMQVLNAERFRDFLMFRKFRSALGHLIGHGLFDTARSLIDMYVLERFWHKLLSVLICNCDDENRFFLGKS